MKSLLTILMLLTTLAFFGCTKNKADEGPQRQIDPAAVDSSKPTDDTSGRDLNIWTDPRFERQFDESYIADTEIEPRVTTLEREVMLEVIETLKAASELEDEQAKILKQDEAVKLIQDNYNDASSAVYDFTLGNIFFEQEKLDEAAAAYRDAVTKHRKFRRAWRALGMVYVRQSKWDQAIPTLTRVIDLGGGDAISYGLLGFAYSSVNNPVSAESAYRQAILLEPDRIDWKMGLARSFFRQERFAEAVALTKKMLEADPNRVDLWLLQANAYLQMDKPMAAAENYELVDRMGKSTPATLNMLGDIYINKELYDLGVNAYVRALKLDDETKADRAIRAAKVLTARGELDLANSMIGTVQEMRGDELTDDQQIDLLRMQSRIAVANGKTGEEIAILEEIIKLDPLDGEALILLGQHASSVALDSNRSAEQAKADAEAAAEKAEADDADEQVKAEAAKLAEEADKAESNKNEKVARAVFYYERAAAIEEFEADAKVRQAQLLVKLGRYEEALPLLRRAQQVKPRENVQQYLEQVERVARSG
jgi:tetratricopeptide (TPR) repeat protein